MVLNSDPPGCLSNARTMGIHIFRYILKRVLGCTVVLKTKKHKGGVKKNESVCSSEAMCVTYFYLLMIPFKLSENLNA